MKWIGILCGLLVSLPVAAAEGEYFSEEIVQQGTLANETLLRDAMPGVAAEVARRGCEVPEQFFAFVLAMPKGKVGERYWHERWISGSGNHLRKDRPRPWPGSVFKGLTQLRRPRGYFAATAPEPLRDAAHTRRFRPR